MFSQKVEVDSSDFGFEIKGVATDWTREMGGAPIIDAVAMVLMFAGSSPHFLVLLEVIQADRAAGCVFLEFQLLGLGLQGFSHEEAAFLSEFSDWHEDLKSF